MNRMLLLTVAVLFTLTSPAQDWAKARLEKSPRHGEWIKVKYGSRDVESFITYPEVKNKATAVVVIHEIFGLTDWARGVTDELAEAGYIAIAPDLLSGMAPKGGGTAELGDGVGKVITALPQEQIFADLDAVVNYVSKLPSCNGKVVVMGFCWGGGQTLRMATHNQALKGALSFYGPIPQDKSAFAKINCPVYGFYGENDARITASVPDAAAAMTAAGKTYEPVTYAGAGHGFMRDGEGPLNPNADEKGKATHKANIKAHDDAWKRVKELLEKL